MRELGVRGEKAQDQVGRHRVVGPPSASGALAAEADLSAVLVRAISIVHGLGEDFAADLARCPRCGLDIHSFYESKDYFEKLILALDHPEQETPIRAAWILGQRRETRAVSALIELIRRTADVYIATAAVEALGEIGTPEALAFLGTQGDHPVRMVRAAARRIVEASHEQAKR